MADDDIAGMGEHDDVQVPVPPKGLEDLLNSKRVPGREEDKVQVETAGMEEPESKSESESEPEPELQSKHETGKGGEADISGYGDVNVGADDDGAGDANQDGDVDLDEEEQEEEEEEWSERSEDGDDSRTYSHEDSHGEGGYDEYPQEENEVVEEGSNVQEEGEDGFEEEEESEKDVEENTNHSEERELHEHEEKEQQKKKEEHPSFVPRRPDFFHHDDRSEAPPARCTVHFCGKRCIHGLSGTLEGHMFVLLLSGWAVLKIGKKKAQSQTEKIPAQFMTIRSIRPISSYSLYAFLLWVCFEASACCSTEREMLICRSRMTASSGVTINLRNVRTTIPWKTLATIRTMTISGVGHAEAEGNFPTEIAGEVAADAVTDHVVVGDEDAAVITTTSPAMRAPPALVIDACNHRAKHRWSHANIRSARAADPSE